MPVTGIPKQTEIEFHNPDLSNSLPNLLASEGVAGLISWIWVIALPITLIRLSDHGVEPSTAPTSIVSGIAFVLGTLGYRRRSKLRASRDHIIYAHAHFPTFSAMDSWDILTLLRVTDAADYDKRDIVCNRPFDELYGSIGGITESIGRSVKRLGDSIGRISQYDDKLIRRTTWQAASQAAVGHAALRRIVNALADGSTVTDETVLEWNRQSFEAWEACRAAIVELKALANQLSNLADAKDIGAAFGTSSLELAANLATINELTAEVGTFFDSHVEVDDELSMRRIEKLFIPTS